MIDLARVLMARELSTAQIISMRDNIKQKLLNFAVKESGKNASELLIRDAMPLTDFDFNSEKWCNQTTQVLSTWTRDWSKELPKTKFIAFYGVVNHTDDPTIIGSKFKVGASGQTVRDVVMHGKMRAEEVVKCYFDPILYKGQETIYVEHYTIAAGGVAQYAEEIELLAFVCEPYGAVISAPQASQ